MQDYPSAFPQADRFSPQGASGMTLRDWFAGQALGLIAAIVTMPNAKADGGGPIDEVTMARSAYGIADAMLAERERSA